MKAVHEHPGRFESAGGLHTKGTNVDDARRILVERIASSRYLNRSARLQEMLLYLSERVIEGHAEQIHEQEVGQRVFGRPSDYDTAADNIVRVHASLLRKRLKEYFSTEGADEPLILEIPKGHYAPLFRERGEADAQAMTPLGPNPPSEWLIWVLAGATALFVCTTAFLLLTEQPRVSGAPSGATARPTVRLFWSQLFRPGRTTDIVLDDAAIALFQNLTGRSLGLSDYFDRDYLRTLPESAGTAKIREDAASAIVLPRESSFSSASFLWKLFQMPGFEEQQSALYFARDYSFRALKADNAVLVGNSRSNPWVQLFDGRVGLRWDYNKIAGAYYPMDTWGDPAAKTIRFDEAAQTHPAYAAISLLPNLGGQGDVLIIGGTGGKAIEAAADFLADETSLGQLRRRLPPAEVNRFPYFEALLSINRRSVLPSRITVVLCRAPRK